ncbi:MAG: IPT/TIG domain-containing protein [Bacteroidetes bacterium]|nr:IPT/TIG domain-containing protein [Bacteroidota bacterium]
MARIGLLVILSVILFSCAKTGNRPGAILPTPPTPTISNFSPDTGNVGTKVVITGYNFSPDASGNLVRVNGVIATVDSSTKNTLFVTVPETATSGRISVTVKGKSFTSIQTFVVLRGSWVQKADFGGSARGKAVGFSIGGKAYILNGYSSSGWESDFWEYDSTTNLWTKKADFAGLGRERCVAFAIGNKGYVGLGYNDATGEHKDLWEYDPALDHWTRKADLPGDAREAAIAFGFDDKGYVGLGVSKTIDSNYKDVWKYEPATNQWTRMNDFPGSASWLASTTSIDTLGYVLFGGTDPSHAGKQFWQYNSLSDQWTPLEDFPGGPRVGGTIFPINKKLYAGLGSDLVNRYGDMWEFNPGNLSWERRANFPDSARSDLIGFAIGNNGYVGTGYSNTGASSKDFWQFIP